MNKKEYCQTVKTLVNHYKVLINISALELRAGMIKNSLHKSLLGMRELTAPEARKVARVLYAMGWEFSGFDLPDKEFNNLPNK